MYQIITEEVLENGKKFAYWVDKYDNIVSYLSKEKINTIIDNTYIPIYVNENETINKNVCINTYWSNNTEDNYLQAQVWSLLPTNQDVTCGLLATSNPNLATVEKLVVGTTNPEIYYKVKNINNRSYFYYWSKANVGTMKWYCRGYVTTKNNNKTYYSDIISIKK